MKVHPLALLALTLACQKPAAPERGEVEAAPQAPVSPPVAVSDKVTVCPQSLGGSETVHRVISRECGAVQVTEDYHVDGGSLTLEAGASLSFKDGVGLRVGGNGPARLIVQGTAAAPVVLTAAGDRTPGVWRGLVLGDGADGSTLEHLVIEYAGADQGALYVDAAAVGVTGLKIRETGGPGLVIGDAGELASFTGNELRKLGSKTAIDTSARALGGLGGGNRFDAGALVLVRAGTVDRSARWQSVGAPLLLTGVVDIDGTAEARAVVELAPGLELRFAEAGALNVGARAPGGLTAKGTAEAPIVFTTHEARTPGGWGGLGVQAQGEATLEQVVLEFAGKDAQRGALAVRGGQLSLRQATFRSDRVGLTLDAAARLPVFADNTFVATPIAVALPAALVAALGEGNAYDRDSKIAVAGGPVSGKATWLAQGVPLELTAEVQVEGELTLEAGVALLAAPQARVTVGATATGTLRVQGTAQAPVTIGPADVVRGSWPGITLAPQATGNVLENLVLTAVSSASAIEVAAGAEVELRGVTCSRCSGAVVGWACGAKVSSSQVLAADGTPAIEHKPEGC